MKKYGIFLVLLFALTSSAFADYVDEREMKIPATDIEVFEINCGAGFLEIQPNTKTNYIEVKAEIVIGGTTRQRAQRFVDEFLKLTLENHGNMAQLESYFDYNNSFSLISTTLKNAEINLTVRVPKNVNLEIDDGSGYITITGLKSDIILDDGSGDIELTNIEGDLEIDDGSGELIIEDITGNVKIDDGSGDISVKNVFGDVEIDDGSGDMKIVSIDGDVTIDDGSGDIRVDKITKNVDLIDDSSGSRMISNVEGKVDLN